MAGACRPPPAGGAPPARLLLPLLLLVVQEASNKLPASVLFLLSSTYCFVPRCAQQVADTSGAPTARQAYYLNYPHLSTALRGPAPVGEARQPPGTRQTPVLFIPTPYGSTHSRRGRPVEKKLWVVCFEKEKRANILNANSPKKKNCIRTPSVRCRVVAHRRSRPGEEVTRSGDGAGAKRVQLSSC